MEIKIINLCKSFGKKAESTFAIKNLNLTINNNSFTTLLGPSGCGKTTLLRMISGLETPDSGQIWFDHTCVYDNEAGINMAPEKRGLGFVFQDFALWPHMTVYENIAFGLRAKRNTEQLDERVREALRAVRLDDMAQRTPGQLSGGQQQRVAFARAIVGNPRCILFDEPLSALDAILRDEMRIEIKRIISELGITGIFVTHDQMEAMSMSDEIVVMNKGKIEQQGKPEEIYHSPESRFVAKFIGKSNWINEDTMFRPEAASLQPVTDSQEFKSKVVSSLFLGDTYELYLESFGHRWVLKSLTRLFPEQEVSVYIHKGKIVNFHEGVSS